MRQLLLITATVIFFVGMVSAQSVSAQSQSASAPDETNAQPNPADQSASAPPYAPPSPAQQQELQQTLKDVHFAFDQYDLNSEDRQMLTQDANWLKANPEVYVTIAGDADERGSISYNLYLSDQRAKVTRDALVEMGVPPDHIVFATGWGKLYPACQQSDESCWSENRRAHFEPWQAGSLAASETGPEGTESANAALPAGSAAAASTKP